MIGCTGHEVACAWPLEEERGVRSTRSLSAWRHPIPKSKNDTQKKGATSPLLDVAVAVAVAIDGIAAWSSLSLPAPVDPTTQPCLGIKPHKPPAAFRRSNCVVLNRACLESFRIGKPPLLEEKLERKKEIGLGAREARGPGVVAMSKTTFPITAASKTSKASRTIQSLLSFHRSSFKAWVIPTCVASSSYLTTVPSCET